ncbi:MAG: N-acetylmuramoyl-L-alanine amidase [Ruminococcaceae bacterium]|nr:N-acetylmuramoyl-L-alanine amidase [Oscillospiraceae bacterium]
MKRTYLVFLLCIFIVCGILGLTVTDSFDNRSIAVSAEARENKPCFIIDAGHGGEDSGALSDNGLLEKDVNLDICLTLEKLLKQSGFDTVMIRTEDVSVHTNNGESVRERKVSDIYNRVDIANSDINNILISIHQNHFSQSEYKGTQVFYSKNTVDSAKLAECIRISVTNLIQNDNKRECKKSSGVYLLDNVKVPAVIVECGFLSNSEEAALLSDEKYRENMAYCIYLGLLEYVYLYN